MNYYLFCKEENKFNLLDIFIIILWLMSLILIILSLTTGFKIAVISNVILLFIKKSIEHKDTIKNDNKIVIDKPIVMDAQNVYILQDKSGTLMLIVAVCCIFMFLIFRISGNMLYYLLIMVVILMFEGNSLLKKSNVNYLKNNMNNLYNILNNKNNKYNINKIEKITKTDNSTYIINFMNQTTKEVLFTEKYENYNELINQLNQRCS